MKYFSLFIAAVFFTAIAHSQYSIKGKITGENNKPIIKATISVSQKAKVTVTTTNEEGYYEITGLANGKCEVIASAAGFETGIEVVTLNNGSLELNFTLSIASIQLQTVEVIGRSARKYNSDYSFSATRTAILNKDLPQSIGTVTKELITDRQAFQLADAVKIIPGVIPSSYYNQYAIRGISQNEEGQIINGMRTRQYYFLQPITSNIERVEVIKGPASATFASVDPGGSINLVTKKPLRIDRKEINLTAGSFSTIRGTLDFTGPLNKDKTLLYRLNGAYQEAKSFRDLVKNNSLLISPSFSYIPNDKTAINAEIIMSNLNGNLDRGQPIFGAVAGVTNLNSTPTSLNLGAPNDFFKSKEFIIMGNLSHKFTKAISFNASYMKQTWQEDLQEHRTNNAFAPDINGQPISSLVGMQLVQRKQNWNIDNINSYFNFDFATGSARHLLLIGYDLQSWEKLKGGGQNAARGFLLKDGTVANSFIIGNASNYQTITYNGQTLPKPNVDHFDLNNPVYTIRNINDYIMNSRIVIPSALTTNNAIYIQEQMNWNKFTVLMSLRQEWFKDITNYEAPGELSFTNSKLLPRIGLTYAVTKNINVYGTYLEGYQPQSNTVTLMPNTGNYFWTSQSASRFKPLISDLKELGVKATVWKGKMHMNAAVYEINQENLLLNANLPAYPDSLITRGAERSRGFEIDVAGYLLPNWQINASYSYIDAEIVEDNYETLKGARKQNTPVNSANLWTRCNFSGIPALKDIGIGIGMQHNGSRIPWFTRAFEVPAYTIIDMAFYYTPGKSNVQIALNVNNVFDKTYWIGAQNYVRLFPGAPRNVMLTATYRF
ncbi:TonB-dependent siderophore receptor [Terrimonas alba]|uniref:TonB-dependent siderophore receptor n=1 Tax=Terrimonas alba TaxID=3349636 RepID=UPI0035F38F32